MSRPACTHEKHDALRTRANAVLAGRIAAQTDVRQLLATAREWPGESFSIAEAPCCGSTLAIGTE